MFSPEMTNVSIVERLLSSVSSVPLSHNRSAAISPDEWTQLASAMRVLYALPFYLDDKSRTVSEFRRIITAGGADTPFSLCVIDYIGLMRSERRSENRQLEITAISADLKALAKDLQFPILVCSQLSRALTGRIDKRPMLSDLRESGSLEQDADMVWFLHRDAYFNRDGASGRAELILAKNRSGPTGTVPLLWLPEIVTFREYTESSGGKT